MIVATLEEAKGVAHPDGCLLVVWCTWPILHEFIRATEGWAWGPVLTGGAWVKWQDPESPLEPGMGYTWLGDSEPVLVYRVGKPFRDPSQLLRNAWFSPRRRHSEKPVGWMRQWMRRWVPPVGGRVLDVFSGLAPAARAAYAEGVEYTGVELDEQRIIDAKALLAQYHSDVAE